MHQSALTSPASLVLPLVLRSELLLHRLSPPRQQELPASLLTQHRTYPGTHPGKHELILFLFRCHFGCLTKPL
jgi:hypothetical protein